jgi:origin recognition complex subunit 1
MAQLRYEQARGDLPAFDFVSLNGMELRHPFEAYVRLWEELSGGARERKPPEVAVAKLEKYFTNDRGHDGHNGDQRIIVVLLDEIDYLFTKKQTVLYSFFDWPIRASERTNGPRLIVVGISNTMHLPSLLKPSVQSRLGKHRCYFKAYKTEDIVTILKDKVKHGSYEVFDEGAIMFAARKTSSMSGDLRKALQICKAAAESVLKDSEEGKWVDPQGKATSPIVRVKNVHRAGQESFGSILNKAVSLTSPFEVLVLISLGSLSKTTGRQIGGFDIDELLTKMESIAKASGERMYLPPPTFGETLEILNRLGESRLVSLSTPKSSSVSFRAAQGGSGGAWPLISLPMESSSIMIALRDTPHQALADKYLGHQGFF